MAAAKLTQQRKRFVDEFLVDMNGAQAAIRAGYSKKSAALMAYKLSKMPVVAAEIEAGMSKLREKMEITKFDLLQSYLDIRDKALEKGRLNDAIRCNDSIAKIMGLNAPERQEVTQIDKIEIEVVDDEEDA